MSRTFVAVALVALLAVAMVSEVSAQKDKTFCRHSSYALQADKVTSIKKDLWAACASKAKVTGGSATQNGKCAVIVQTVADKAAWDAYSACEKSQPGYSTLKAASSACAQYQKSGAC